MGKFSQHLLIQAILLTLILIFVGAWGINNPFVYDSIGKIVENSDIRQLKQLPENLIYPYSEKKTRRRNDPTRPVVYLTYALNDSLTGQQSLSYRITDLIVHLATALLLLFFSHRIFYYFYGSYSSWYPFSISLLWAVSPVMIGNVFYAYARPDLLVALFTMSSLLLWASTRIGVGLKLTSVSLIFGLALFSKQSAIVLPALIIAHDRWLGTHYSKSLRTFTKERIHLYAPLFGVAIAWLLFYWSYFAAIGDVEAEPSSLWGRWNYLTIQPYVILNYIRLLAFPVDWSLIYPFYPDDISNVLRFLTSLLFIGGLFQFLVWSRRKPQSIFKRCVLFAVFFFLISLMPTSSIFPTSDPMTGRRMYRAGIGFFLAVGLFLHEGKLFNKPVNQKKLVGFALLGCFFLLSISMSVYRLKLRQQPLKMWDRVVQQYPDSDVGLLKQAKFLVEKGKKKQAIKSYKKLLSRYPGHFKGMNSLGVMYMENGQYKKARRWFQKALSLQPTYRDAQINMKRLKNFLKDKEVTSNIKTRVKEAAKNFSSFYETLIQMPASKKVTLKKMAPVLIPKYQRKLEKNKNDTKIRKKFILYLAFTGRRKQAIKELHKLNSEQSSKEASRIILTRALEHREPLFPSMSW